MAGRHEKVMPEDKESDEDQSIGDSTEVSDEEETGSDDSNEDEEDSGENNEEEDEEEQDDEEDVVDIDSDSSESTEYDSSDVWSEHEDEVEVQTKEATEAAIMNDFLRSLDLIVSGDKDKAKKILQKILKCPSVAKHTSNEFLWEHENNDTMLNKMGRVFVGTHKNLALIDEENAIEHLLQVVALAPRNDDVWFELGQKCVQLGDLDMAIFSFGQTNDWRASEALISTHFLKKNYKTTLQLIASREELNGPFKKGEFLKKRISCMNDDLSEYVFRLFGKRSFDVDPIYEKEASSRLEAVQAKLLDQIDQSIMNDKEEEYEPIEISLNSNQSAWDIMIVFCDLFDRINTYSSIYSQRIFITEWESREEKRIVEDTVMDMVDDVITVENVVEKMMDEVDNCMPSTSYHLPDKVKVKKNQGIHKIIGRRDRMRGDESSCDETESSTRPASVDSIALREPSAIGDIHTYYLDGRPVRPLKEGTISQGPSRLSSTPVTIGNEEYLLLLIREALWEERYLTVVKAIEICLSSIVMVDCLPPRSSHNGDTLNQIYRRFCRTSSRLLERHHISIHAYMTLYDDPMAMNYCLQVYYSSIDGVDEKNIIRFPTKRDLMRFLHKRLECLVGNVEGTLKLLRFMRDSFDEGEAYNVLGGVISRESIIEILEKKERSSRIRSLKHLSLSKKWKEVVSIIESDCHWSTVDDEKELEVRTTVYVKALIALNRLDKAIHIINRMLSQLLSQPILPATLIEPWIRILSKIKFTSINEKSTELPSLGYSLLRLTEHSHLARDWKLWRVLHQVIKRIEQSRPCLLSTILSDESNDIDYDEMPTRSLRFLVHAHDRLSYMEVCGQQKGAFLIYMMNEMESILSDKRIRELLREKKLSWMASNVQGEIYQLLHCTFGRYSKKRRAAEDHESGIELGEERRDIVQCAVSLSLPNPLPEFDDRGTAGSDLVELINNRFPSVLTLNDRRKNAIARFKTWLERGPVIRNEDRNDEEKMNASLLSWPRYGVDTTWECVVFYLYTLYYYRSSKHTETLSYAEMLLSSNSVIDLDKKIQRSAWIMLGHSTVERLFKLYDDDLLVELNQQIRPFRVAMALSDKTDSTVPFSLAHALYQASTRIDRFFHRLTVSDLRLRHNETLVDRLREETIQLFEKVVEVAPSMQEANQTAWDYQWLAYFFLSKLHNKNGNIVEAIDNMFESACALQMGGTVYLQKIPVKNQKNFEPVEVHYQAHSMIWKYITRTDNPPFEVLTKLRSYAEAFSRHGVVRPSAAMDLYEIEPVISETALNLTFLCWKSGHESTEENLLNETLNKVELIEELTQMCKEAFKVVVERFPHRKAYHRLAQISLKDNDPQTAHIFIFKKIFPRRKKEDDLFESVLEITCADFERSDALAFHVTRSLRLGIRICVKLGDATPIMAMFTSITRAIKETDEIHVLKVDQMMFVIECLRGLNTILSSHPSQWSKNVKIEALSVYNSIKDEKSIRVLVFLREELKKIITRYQMGGIIGLEREVSYYDMRKQGGSHKRRRIDDSSRNNIPSNLGRNEQSILDRLGVTRSSVTVPSSSSSSVQRPSISHNTPPAHNLIQLIRPNQSSNRLPSQSIPSSSSSSSTSNLFNYVSNPNEILQLIAQAHHQQPRPQKESQGLSNPQVRPQQQGQSSQQSQSLQDRTRELQRMNEQEQAISKIMSTLMNKK